MGRMAKFSTEEIEAACQALQAEGRYSVGNVRLRLGGGGYAYLAPICQAWAERTAAAALQPVDALVPESFRRAVHGLVGVVREAGRQEAASDAGRLRLEHDEALAELAGRDARDTELQTALDEARDQAAAQAAQHGDEVTKLRHEVARVSESWAHAQTLLTTAEQRCADATRAQQVLQARLDKERAERTELLQKLSAFEERCTWAERRAAEMQQEQAQLVAHLRGDLQAAAKALQEEKQERIAATQRAQASSDAQLATLQERPQKKSG